jgi:hypothetical protein
MEVWIVRRPPAPSMDGFNMRGLEVGRVYEVDDRTAQYLIDSGYARTAEATKQDRANDKPKRERMR